MTMMQKVQAKKSKKGFTLVELVIVIAILAILAAIAIPVITTTINSAKISTMESDCATCNMIMKEWINTYKANITTTTYGPDKKTAADANLGEVLGESGMDSSDDFFSRTIGGTVYKMVWESSGDDGALVVSSDDGTTAVKAADGVTDFATM